MSVKMWRFHKDLSRMCDGVYFGSVGQIKGDKMRDETAVSNAYVFLPGLHLVLFCCRWTFSVVFKYVILIECTCTLYCVYMKISTVCGGLKVMFYNHRPLSGSTDQHLLGCMPFVYSVNTLALLLCWHAWYNKKTNRLSLQLVPLDLIYQCWRYNFRKGRGIDYIGEIPTQCTSRTQYTWKYIMALRTPTVWPLYAMSGVRQLSGALQSPLWSGDNLEKHT